MKNSSLKTLIVISICGMVLFNSCDKIRVVTSVTKSKTGAKIIQLARKTRIVQKAEKQIINSPAFQKIEKQIINSPAPLRKVKGWLGYENNAYYLPVHDLVAYSRVTFNVINASGKVITANGQTLTKELKSAHITEKEMIKILCNLQKRVDKAKSKSEMETAFLEAYNEVDTSVRSLFYLSGGVVMFLKKSITNRDFYIQLALE
jgi:hypothetical protein